MTEDLLEGVEDDVRVEARKILGQLGDWAVAEVGRAAEAPDSPISYPSGGGHLANMTLDEAIARADALDSDLDEDLAAKKERRERAGKIVDSILTTALRIIVTGGMAAL